MPAAKRIGQPRGQLAANGTLVQLLQSALSHADSNAKTIPGLFVSITEGEAWREYAYTDRPDKVFRWNAADFRRFIEAPRKDGGCETPVGVLVRMLWDTPAWESFQELTRGKVGGQAGNQNAKAEETIRNSITDRLSADAVDSPPTLRVRDYSRESKQGDSVGYCLRRLGKSRPDLLEKVRAGDLSAHAAMVEAGFKERQITIPVDPAKAARRLVRHFSRKQFNSLVEETLRLYGEQA